LVFFDLLRSVREGKMGKVGAGDEMWYLHRFHFISTELSGPKDGMGCGPHHPPVWRVMVRETKTPLRVAPHLEFDHDLIVYTLSLYRVMGVGET
jgi:hypothetical protein